MTTHRDVLELPQDSHTAMAPSTGPHSSSLKDQFAPHIFLRKNTNHLKDCKLTSSTVGRKWSNPHMISVALTLPPKLSTEGHIMASGWG